MNNPNDIGAGRGQKPVKTVERDEPPRVSGVSQDARARFAELLRRTERNGERIRLTRRGMPFAYIVPLSDGEKLQHYELMAARRDENGGDQGGFPEMPELPEMDQFQSEDAQEDQAYDHGDETERGMAITAFKKSVMRILTDTHELKRQEIQDKFKDDNYIGTAIRKVIGLGGR